MLETKVIYAASVIAEERAAKGQVILPIPNTPLAELCAATNPMGQLPVDAEELVQLSAETIEVGNFVPGATPDAEEVYEVSQVSPHKDLMSIAVADVVDRIGEAKTIAREHALPKSRALWPEIEKRVDNIMLAPKLVPTVVMSYYPKFYDSTHHDDLVGTPEARSGYIEPLNAFKPNDKFATIPGETLRNLLATGNTEYDVLVLKAVETVTDAALEDIYNHFFRGIRLLTLKDEFLFNNDGYVVFRNSREAAVPAMLCYTWALTLRESIQEGNVMLGDNYDVLLQRAGSVAKNGMAMISQQRDRQHAAGFLILSRPTAFELAGAADITKLQITVSADTYIKYLEMGGSPEAVTAAVILDVKNLGVKLIDREYLLANNDYLMSKYREYINMKNSEAQSLRLRAYSLAFKGVFNDLIIPELNEGGREGVVTYVENVVKAFSDKDIANFQQIFREHLVNCLYPENALTVNRLIDEIDAILADRRELSVFEAATVATVNLAADYVASQIYILEV